ncbi:hypothetical protein [Enterocloster clostridioformis]|uniref:Uncharacterized protein n=1 Tax=Enterocloster clostridioformis TaxID=1531 RepID=A0A174NYM5_9FIRM|nr:hypothetical protein [Enterocloster clostridioformis]CUP51105.1 Uncharacterised protein [Enterocloster clostridioformis]
MAKVNLEELVGGGLQEVFAKAMEEVVENMQNPNTPYKTNEKSQSNLDLSRMRTGMTQRWIFPLQQSWLR